MLCFLLLFNQFLISPPPFLHLLPSVPSLKNGLLSLCRMEEKSEESQRFSVRVFTLEEEQSKKEVRMGLFYLTENCRYYRENVNNLEEAACLQIALKGDISLTVLMSISSTIQASLKEPIFKILT